MKDLHIDICNANNGEIPEDLTLDDAVLMRKWNIYNWEDFQKKCREYFYKKENAIEFINQNKDDEDDEDDICSMLYGVDNNQ